MAVKLATPTRFIRMYLPNLRTVVQHFRTFSSQTPDESKTSSYSAMEPDITQVEWPDPALGPLNTSDRRFPLPGQIGLAQVEHRGNKREMHQQGMNIDPFVFILNQPSERHFNVLARYVKQEEEFELEEFFHEQAIPKPSDLLECAAYDCPKILRKDFADLFPERNTMEGPFTVITLSHHTENDMTTWSVDVEEERESLLEMFMHGAMEICNSLQKNGFWADFIDPSTGKPFRGSHTNSTFFETDERYRKFGFQIEDLGCCKVIRHSLWGTHAFVSCLFTNAPVDHAIINKIIN